MISHFLIPVCCPIQKPNLEPKREHHYSYCMKCDDEEDDDDDDHHHHHHHHHHDGTMSIT